MPKAVKFTTDYSHQLDLKFRKSWPVGWTGELDDDIALAARKFDAIEFAGTPAEVEEAEAWFAECLKAEKKAEKAAAAAAKKAGADAESDAEADTGTLV